MSENSTTFYRLERITEASLKQIMASGDTKPEAMSFEQQFQEFSNRIQFFTQCLTDCQAIIRPMQSVYDNDLNADAVNAFISEKETREFREFTSKKASVLVVGQTNSGKSSLINELLGARYLPTAEVPCTSRIVRVRYSAENYIEVHGPSGDLKSARRTFKKKSVPRSEIALDDSKRTEKDWVRCVVEVGLNNSLLQGGHLEFVDAPGMSENEVLDDIVEECLHGILQVVIYVIDGNSSLRAQDRDFLYTLKQKLGSIPIFFVCNKVDTDERAAVFDRDSDDSDTELDEEAKWERVQEKKTSAFNALIRSGLIASETEIETCDFFHGISTLQVRRARRKELVNRYTEAFEAMKKSFLTFVAVSVNDHLHIAARNLLRVQRRVFDFYISRDPKRGSLESIQRHVETIAAREEIYFQRMRAYIIENTPKLENMINDVISSREADILRKVETMEFAPIQIGDVVHRNEIINQCRTQIQKMVLLNVLEVSTRKAAGTVKTVTDNMRQILERALQEAAKHEGFAGRLLDQQLRTSCLDIHLNVKVMVQMTPGVQDFALMSYMYQTWDEAKRFLTDLKSMVFDTTVNRQWKRKIAKNVLRNIDIKKVSRRIFGIMLDDLHANHESFVMNLSCIEKLSKVADQQSERQLEAIAKYANQFAETICRNEALIATLSHPEVRLLGKTGRPGHRGTVYNCQVAGSYGDVVAKQLRLAPSESNLQFVALQHCLTRLSRLDADHSRVIFPSAIVLVDFKFTFLLPRCTTDLYSALSDDVISSVPQHDRVVLLRDITEACKYSREKSLQLIDPRITNVRIDAHFRGKLDVSKSREDSVPYPDGLAPFHVRSSPPPLVHASPKILNLATQHDVYSLGIMGWLLGVGKYIRPSYAVTYDISVIYDAMKRDAQPDIELISDEMEQEYKDFGAIVLDCFTEGTSLWDLASKLDDILKQKQNGD